MKVNSKLYKTKYIPPRSHNRTWWSISCILTEALITMNHTCLCDGSHEVRMRLPRWIFKVAPVVAAGRPPFFKTVRCSKVANANSYNFLKFVAYHNKNPMCIFLADRWPSIWSFRDSDFLHLMAPPFPQGLGWSPLLDSLLPAGRWGKRMNDEDQTSAFLLNTDENVVYHQALYNCKEG